MVIRGIPGRGPGSEYTRMMMMHGDVMTRLECDLRDLLEQGEWDDDFRPPEDSVIDKLRGLLSSAVDDGSCPIFSLSTLGGGDIRMHFSDPSGRHFRLHVSPDDSGMTYIYYDGDGLYGVEKPVDEDLVSRRIKWLLAS